MHKSIGTDNAALPPTGPATTVAPSDRHAEVALRASMVLMAPVARWLIRNGVQYGAFATALKSVFLQVAREEIEGSGRKATDSALSVLSGVHRKDVRALTGNAARERRAKPLSLVSQVFTRWVTDVRYREDDGTPKRLPRLGEQGSFEALAREVSSDVHPRTLLDELARLGLVKFDGDVVELLTAAFVPAADYEELAALLGENAADHIAAAVQNLTTPQPRLLEQSVYADGLSVGSVGELGQLARELWGQAFQRMVVEAQSRCDTDREVTESHRMRFGVYYYSEPVRDERGPQG
ncbi:DUF6502 family protein [Caldimonas brevitalea]|uniref:Uncharacterized protein n=1 Tax=Caldimonas brevitalea TaxID=413882 RepID=A0A0G3BGP3_9BURK|nr:DUF6502 family protein [Caldimonas brevitalea]AKJ28619.1 hypothetical protein AAW51_1928 [Caldimonas brevitalea]